MAGFLLFFRTFSEGSLLTGAVAHRLGGLGGVVRGLHVTHGLIKGCQTSETVAGSCTDTGLKYQVRSGQTNNI